MTNHSYYLGAYWAARQEGAVDCARRFAAMLQALKPCDAMFARWQYVGTSPRVPWMGEILPDEDYLRSLLEQGRSHRDDTGATIPSLGFTQSIRAEDVTRQSVDLSLTCGLDIPGASLGNRCVLFFPTHGEAADRLLRAHSLASIMDVIVRSFEPDWATVSSYSSRTATFQRQAGEPCVGWLTYLPVSAATIPALPPPTQVTACGRDGALIITTDEPFSPDNPAHVRATRRVVEALRKARLLRSTKQQWHHIVLG